MKYGAECIEGRTTKACLIVRLSIILVAGQWQQSTKADVKPTCERPVGVICIVLQTCFPNRSPHGGSRVNKAHFLQR